MRRILGSVLLIGFLQASAQVNVKDSLVAVPMIIPHVAMHFPVGNLSSRFGMNFHLGGSFLFKHRSNWLWGASGTFIFGENVNEPFLLKPILPIFDRDGQLPSVALGMRGFTFIGLFGKVLPVSNKPNRNSGITLLLGTGFIQHWIHLQTRGGLTPQLEGDYLKGYDRLTNGFCASQFIGYTFLGNKRTLNFYAGFEFIQGITQNRRGYNYDTFQFDNDTKIDLMLGIKAGWIFPIYPRKGRAFSTKDKEYFYY